MPDTGKYQIILEKVSQDRQPDATAFLSGCFSLLSDYTSRIAGSGPIALVSGLSRPQAEAVLAELAASLPPGVEIRIAREGEADNVSRLQWPRPPRINGKELSAFAARPAAREVGCPVCGSLIRVAEDGVGGLRAVTAEPGKGKKLSAESSPAVDESDPVFFGLKPSAAAGNLASIRSLDAGDSGFWGNSEGIFTAPPPPSPPPRKPGETSNAKSSTGRIAAGLAAFMKPGAFGLVVGRTRDNQTVKMIAEIMGVREDEARDKCMNLGLCVARDISLDEAQNLLSRFKSLGAKARIVKPG